MLRDGQIQVDRVWKRFRVDQSRSLLRDQLQRLADRLRGRPAAWNWALRDISFDVQPGESIGLFGANGSGKSTLLKIIANVMYPYAGRSTVVGRIGALIEVRAGIHPQLTGRENVYLYGSLLGLPRRAVAERFDQIVSFAELDDAIDRQVKFYSTGMQMRLGFAVAAFLEPDILLVDEVLAVGDASFQQKCLDRMREVLVGGTTLFFVSHELQAVQATCERGVWIDRGDIQIDGPVDDALGAYRRSIEAAAAATVRPQGEVSILKIQISGPQGGLPATHEALDITLRVTSGEAKPGRLFLGVSEGPGSPIFSISRDFDFSSGETDVRCTIPSLPLARGRFFLWAGIYGVRRRAGRDLLAWQPVGNFDVAGPNLEPAPPAVVRMAPVQIQATWEVDRV